MRTFKGYRLLAVDGTVMNYSGYENDNTNMPDYPGLNQFHVNAMFDDLNRVYIDAIIEPRLQVIEQLAARKMIQRALPSERKIMISDRGYGSFSLMEYARKEPDTDYLIRIKDNLWMNLTVYP